VFNVKVWKITEDLNS